METSLKWYGVDVTKAVHKTAGARLALALRMLKNAARTQLNRMGATITYQSHHKVKMGKREREVLKIAEPGPEGGFPHKRTGRGRMSVDIEIDPSGLKGRYGTNIPYMKWLETGTRKHVVRVKTAKVLANPWTGQIFGKQVTIEMKARPWMSLTNKEAGDRVRALLTGKLDSDRPTLAFGTGSD